MKAFHILVLQHFYNFKSIRKIIVVSEKMPSIDSVKQKETDEVLEIKEMQDYEVIINDNN